MKPDGESVFPFMNFRNKRLKYVWKLQEKKNAEPRSQAPRQEDSFFTSCCCDYERVSARLLKTMWSSLLISFYSAVLQT